jgi:hypothetical protein
MQQIARENEELEANQSAAIVYIRLGNLAKARYCREA